MIEPIYVQYHFHWSITPTAFHTFRRLRFCGIDPSTLYTWIGRYRLQDSSSIEQLSVKHFLRLAWYIGVFYLELGSLAVTIRGSCHGHTGAAALAAPALDTAASKPILAQQTMKTVQCRRAVAPRPTAWRAPVQNSNAPQGVSARTPVQLWTCGPIVRRSTKVSALGCATPEVRQVVREGTAARPLVLAKGLFIDAIIEQYSLPVLFSLHRKVVFFFLLQ
ncbi:unnamed protein product [Nesidiocoris tenuis]|uniref:Uncharacterized protein n=1 Tax=Nesidiocoris tenuis TaxID=355587 RepID=A0A6H5GFA9_9HEMI|nr:unnamed protein product [Nesidiocoris tenuis]